MIDIVLMEDMAITAKCYLVYIAAYTMLMLYIHKMDIVCIYGLVGIAAWTIILMKSYQMFSEKYEYDREYERQKALEEEQGETGSEKEQQELQEPLVDDISSIMDPLPPQKETESHDEYVTRITDDFDRKMRNLNKRAEKASVMYENGSLCDDSLSSPTIQDKILELLAEVIADKESINSSAVSDQTVSGIVRRTRLALSEME